MLKYRNTNIKYTVINLVMVPPDFAGKVSRTGIKHPRIEQSLRLEYVGILFYEPVHAFIVCANPNIKTPKKVETHLAQLARRGRIPITTAGAFVPLLHYLFVHSTLHQ